MKNRETVRPMTAGQMKELTAAVIEAIPANLPFDAAKGWIGNKGKLGKGIRKVLISGDNDVITQELKEWLDLYRDCFGTELELDKIALPAEQENTWLVIADERVTNSQVYDAWEKLFPRYRYMDNLNKVYDLHAKGTTARRFKAVVEADEEYRNKSANDVESAGLTPKTITLKERMLLEIWYFKKTGKHLDIDNWTLCAGSRYPDGYVPGVYWSVGGVSVSWDSPDSQDDCLRPRVAVS